MAKALLDTSPVLVVFDKLLMISKNMLYSKKVHLAST